jgi:hypothetical protein
MRHGRFFGFCIMILAGIFILILGTELLSYGPKSPGEQSRVGPPTEINRSRRNRKSARTRRL